MAQPPVVPHTRQFALLDANVVAAYYLPESSRYPVVAQRIRRVIDGFRRGRLPGLFLYVPNFCVGEVFNVFSKYRFGKWNPQMRKRMPRGLSPQRYARIRNSLRDDLKRYRIFYSYPVSRFHILAIDLISPIDNWYQYYRRRTKPKNLKPLSTFDQLIAAMGIELVHIHQHNNFSVITADNRLAAILAKARGLRTSAIKRFGLVTIAADLGLSFQSDLYPKVMNLARCSNNEFDIFLDGSRRA